MKTGILAAVAVTVLASPAFAIEKAGTRLFVVNFKKEKQSQTEVQMCDDTYYDNEIELMIPRFRGLHIKKIIGQCKDAKLVRAEAVSTGERAYIRMRLKNAWQNCEFNIEGPMEGSQGKKKATYLISLGDAC